MIETAIIECSVKNVFLKSRINWGEILRVGNNNQTKAITMKVLTIFIVIVYNFFRCVFDTETEAQLAKCIAVVCNLGFSPTSPTLQKIIKCNDLIKYRDGSMTPAIFGINVFVTIVYGYQ